MLSSPEAAQSLRPIVEAVSRMVAAPGQPFRLAAGGLLLRLFIPPMPLGAQPLITFLGLVVAQVWREERLTVRVQEREGQLCVGVRAGNSVVTWLPGTVVSAIAPVHEVLLTFPEHSGTVIPLRRRLLV